MNPSDDRAYFAQREEAARRLAQNAADPAVRQAHTAMAAAYRRRKREAAEDALTPH